MTKMLQEICRTSSPVSKNDEVSITWHNSVLTLRTDREIFFYEFSRNLQCLDKTIDLMSTSMQVSKSSPLSGLIPSRFLKGVSNIDFTEMILDPSLWPHNPILVQEMTNIADLQWSPVGFIRGNASALAILNNIGNVDMFVQERLEWHNILDLSLIMKEKFLSTGEMDPPKTLEDLKELAYTLETSAICWGPKLENTSSLFATAQKNGNIIFWILLHQDLTIKPESLGEIHTEVGEIVTMMWIPRPEKHFAIICSNVFGQIYALECCISDNFQVCLLNTVLLWSYKDKMVTKYMAYTMLNDKIVLACNKHRHLVVQLIDKNCQVIAQFHKNINDYRITDIKTNDNGIYVTTTNSKVYKLLLKLPDNNLDVTFELIKMNDFPTHELYSLTFSDKNVIWAMAMRDRKVMHKQRIYKTVEIVFFSYTNPDIPDELSLLLNNPTEKLTHYWDCIELLRYKTLKTKTMPPIDYNEFYNETDKNIYKVKLYFIFLNFLLSLEKLARNKSRFMLPEMSLESVKEKIFALHACQLISEIDENFDKDLAVDDLQVQAYCSATKYLRHYCSKYNTDINQFFISKYLTKLSQYEVQYTCQSCDEDVHGFTCNSGHFNLFCSLTFTPIDGHEYISCRSCGSVAKEELYQLSPMCIFCDRYFSDFHLPKIKSFE